jgi:hypothetical protein
MANPIDYETVESMSVCLPGVLLLKSPGKPDDGQHHDQNAELYVRNALW